MTKYFAVIAAVIGLIVAFCLSCMDQAKLTKVQTG